MADQRRVVADSSELADDDHVVARNRARGTDTESTTLTRSAEPTTVTRTESRPSMGTRAGYRVHEDTDVEIPEALNITRDRVRWGPIWAGVLTAMTSLLMLSLLGAAIGLTTVNAGDAAVAGSLPENTGRNAALWGGISALIAFLLGGYVAGATAAVFNRGWGALNGLLVFLLAVPLMLWLASQGLGSILGTLGNYGAAFNVDPNAAQNAAQGAADQARQAAQNVQPIDVARAASRARDTAWATLGALALAGGAATLGGFLGTRRTVEVGDMEGRVRA